MVSYIARMGVWLAQFHDALCRTLFYLAGLLLFSQAFAISYEVFVRYFFNKPTLWAMDFSEYTLVYSTFMATPWLLRIGGHTSVNAIVDNLKGQRRHLVEIGVGVIGIAVCSIVAYIGVLDTLDAYWSDVMIVRPVIIPKYAIYWIIPFGIILLLVYFLRGMVGAIRLFRSTRPAEVRSHGG